MRNRNVDAPSEAGGKPSSVPPLVTHGEVTVIHLGPSLPTGSSDYPEAAGGAPRTHYGPLPLRLAPSGVYHAIPVTGDPVRSYRTLSPLPVGAEAWTGGLLSVALSLRSPSPVVIRHPRPVELGLSSPGTTKARRRSPILLRRKHAPGRMTQGAALSSPLAHRL